MPTVENVENKIAKIETFEVRIKRESDGRDVRGDRDNLPTFKRQRAMKGFTTVAHWRRVRFDSMYPGFDVDVLYADGTIAAGQTRLTTVRDTYYEGLTDHATALADRASQRGNRRRRTRGVRMSAAIAVRAQDVASRRRRYVRSCAGLRRRV